MHVMPFKNVFFSLVVLSFFSSCVSSKVHRAEVLQRNQCEAREKVLVQEVLSRRAESADLVKQVGELNRTLGNQDAEIRTLKQELTVRTQSMGESSSKLFAEKTELEKQLAGKSAQLAQREATLGNIAAVQRNRQTTLNDLKKILAAGYPTATGAAIDVADQAILLTLPDQGLFDKTGLAISTSGRDLLQPLAEILANRPELAVEVLAYTDNVLPKGIKNISDTWDWSLARAVNVTRLLIRDFNINANQLTPVGKGEYYPVASNETSEGRQRNRRTVLVIYPSLPKIPGAE